MADEAEQAVETAQSEQTDADSATAQQTEETTSESNDSQTGQETEADASSGEQEQKQNEQSQNKDSQETQKPKSRRSAAFRLQQVLKENQELKQRAEQNGNTQTDEPDIQALIDAAVEKRLNPVISESSKTADDAELSELFSDGKHDRKYETGIREMWNQTQYKDVAASDLYKIVSFDDAVQTAATKAIEDYKKAEKDAKESSASGNSNSNRSGEKKPLSDSEFQQKLDQVKANL